MLALFGESTGLCRVTVVPHVAKVLALPLRDLLPVHEGINQKATGVFSDDEARAYDYLNSAEPLLD